jgi:thiaminase
MYSHTKDDLLYTFTPSPNLATLGAALKQYSDNFNSQLKPIFEQLEAQMKPLKEYVIKQANAIRTTLNAKAKHYVKFLKFVRHKAEQGFSALLPKPILIARRYKSPPRIYTNKHFRVLVPQLIVLSSVITPNAPN